MRSLTFGFPAPPPAPLCRIRAPDREPARLPLRRGRAGQTIGAVRSPGSAPRRVRPKKGSPVCLKIIGSSVAYTRCERPPSSPLRDWMVRLATHDRGARVSNHGDHRGDVERISASRSSARATPRGRIEAQRPSGDPMPRGSPRGRRVGTREPIGVVREAGAVPRRRRRRVHPHPRATRARIRGVQPRVPRVAGARRRDRARDLGRGRPTREAIGRALHARWWSGCTRGRRAWAGFRGGPTPSARTPRPPTSSSSRSNPRGRGRGTAPAR